MKLTAGRLMFRSCEKGSIFEPIPDRSTPIIFEPIPDRSTPILVAPVLTVEADNELDVERVWENEGDGKQINDAHEEKARLVLEHIY